MQCIVNKHKELNADLINQNPIMIMCLSVRNTFYKAVTIKKPKFREEYLTDQALHITYSSVFQVSFS